MPELVLEAHGKVKTEILLKSHENGETTRKAAENAAETKPKFQNLKSSCRVCNVKHQVEILGSISSDNPIVFALI